MHPTSRIGRQLAEIISALTRINAQSALIGGLALAPHKVVRATSDVVPILLSTSGEQTHPLVAEGGIPYTPDPNRDPFEALDDLMTVVDALCPTWPSREPFVDGLNWRL
jgi:hypothetical protein